MDEGTKKVSDGIILANQTRRFVGRDRTDQSISDR